MAYPTDSVTDGLLHSLKRAAYSSARPTELSASSII